MSKRICAECGKEFEGAITARTCSGACRQKAYRRRLKEKAKQKTK